jgi:hypothetical protein
MTGTCAKDGLGLAGLWWNHRLYLWTGLPYKSSFRAICCCTLLAAEAVELAVLGADEYLVS